MSSVEREAPSQRRHLRVRAPVFILVDNRRYSTDNWSLSGFQISDCRSRLRVGEVYPVRFLLEFQGFSISFDQEAEVVRTSPDGRRVAARFKHELSDRHRDLVNHFISSWIRGEHESVDNTIRRLDIPVTPVSGMPDPTQQEFVPLRRRGFRRKFFSAAYLFVGLALTLFIALTLYDNFFRLSVATAVVTRDVVPITAQFDGVLDALQVGEGGVVDQGQILFRLRNEDVIRELDNARVDLADALAEVEIGRARREQEQKKLRIYRDIANKKLTLARDRVAALDSQLETAAKDLERMRLLRDQGLGSVFEFDQAFAEHARLRGESDVAKSELAIARAAIESVESGYFYDDRHLVGDLQKSQLGLETAKKKVDVLQNRLEMIRKRAKALSYGAPIAGKVLKYTRLPGTAVRKGETILFLETAHSQPRIEAFLTQSEVERVLQGSRALVYVPSLRKQFGARVERIDRTSAQIDLDMSRYSWMDDTSRTALVTLAIESLQPDEQDQLTGGLPVSLNLQRSSPLEPSPQLTDALRGLLGVKEAYARSASDPDE